MVSENSELRKKVWAGWAVLGGVPLRVEDSVWEASQELAVRDFEVERLAGRFEKLRHRVEWDVGCFFAFKTPEPQSLSHCWCVHFVFSSPGDDTRCTSFERFCPLRHDTNVEVWLHADKTDNGRHTVVHVPYMISKGRTCQWTEILEIIGLICGFRRVRSCLRYFQCQHFLNFPLKMFKV